MIGIVLQIKKKNHKAFVVTQSFNCKVNLSSNKVIFSSSPALWISLLSILKEKKRWVRKNIVICQRIWNVLELLGKMFNMKPEVGGVGWIM